MRLLPVKLFFIKKTKKFKKVVQNMSKRWSKTMPVRTPNPVFRESFFKFWNSHTNQVLKTPISSGRVTQLISAPWKVITSRRRRERGEREEERGFLFWAHQRQGASRKNCIIIVSIGVWSADLSRFPICRSLSEKSYRSICGYGKVKYLSLDDCIVTV